jgi:type II secretion system protein I
MIMIKKNKGFTLLEVLLSLSIISVSLLAVINCFSGAVSAKKSVLNYTQAMLLADEKLFEIQNADFNKIEKKGNFNPPYEKFQWGIDASSTDYSNLAQVDLTVSWTQQGREKSIQVATIIDK